jgi:hypothetical protein
MIFNFPPNSLDPYQTVDHKTYNNASPASSGILYILVHFNRCHHFNLTYSSILQNLYDNDALWVVDHGSNFQHLATISNCISHTKRESNAPLCFTRLQPNIPGAQYVWLMKQLMNHAESLPSHYILLADDDYLLPHFRKSVSPYLDSLTTLSVGFSYHNSLNLEALPSSRSFSSSTIEMLDSTNQWISAVASLNTIRLCLDSLVNVPIIKILCHSVRLAINKSLRASYSSVQQHSSASIISFKSLFKASSEFDNLFPFPYSDVGNILINYRARNIHLDENLVSIGVGVNYGMTTDIFKMRANHFCPYIYIGLPSHKKMLAITYFQVLFQLKSSISVRSLAPLLLTHTFESSLYLPVFLTSAIRKGPVQAVKLLKDYFADIQHTILLLLCPGNRDSILLSWLGFK